MKVPMTLEQHKELGKQVRSMYSQISKLLVTLHHHYALSNPALKNADKAHHHLDQMRCALDSQVFKDCPTEADKKALMNIYYGAPTI